MDLQIVNAVGAAFVLVAFVLLQLKRTTRESVLFNLLNVGGSFCLGLVAVFDLRYGWIVLESAWFSFSVSGLLRGRRESVRPKTVERPTQPPDNFTIAYGGSCDNCGRMTTIGVNYIKTYSAPYCLKCASIMYGLAKDERRRL